MSEPVQPVRGDEWATLIGFLEHQRSVIRAKTAGFGAAELNAPVTPSTMTLGGLLKHLAYVENFWFVRVWAGQDAGLPWSKTDWQADPDWDWNSAAHDSPAELRAMWDEAVARSRAIADADPTVDGVSVGPSRSPGKFSRRWILLHMIAEYARHAGHADYLAESLDGRTGD